MNQPKLYVHSVHNGGVMNVLRCCYFDFVAFEMSNVLQYVRPVNVNRYRQQVIAITHQVIIIQ